MFKFFQTARKVMYTTNVMESLNSGFQRLNRGRTIFPNTIGLLKALYMATWELITKWTMPIRNWGQVYAELDIMYLGRMSRNLQFAGTRTEGVRSNALNRCSSCVSYLCQQHHALYYSYSIPIVWAFLLTALKNSLAEIRRDTFFISCHTSPIESFSNQLGNAMDSLSPLARYFVNVSSGISHISLSL